MRPSRRRPMNKRKGARQFHKNRGRSNVMNHRTSPMRGGYRM